jgi:hypothetical protein
MLILRDNSAIEFVEGRGGGPESREVRLVSHRLRMLTYAMLPYAAVCCRMLQYAVSKFTHAPTYSSHDHFQVVKYVCCVERMIFIHSHDMSAFEQRTVELLHGANSR